MVKDTTNARKLEITQSKFVPTSITCLGVTVKSEMGSIDFAGEVSLMIDALENRLDANPFPVTITYALERYLPEGYFPCDISAYVVSFIAVRGVSESYFSLLIAFPLGDLDEPNVFRLGQLVVSKTSGYQDFDIKFCSEQSLQGEE